LTNYLFDLDAVFNYFIAVEAAWEASLMALSILGDATGAFLLVS